MAFKIQNLTLMSEPPSTPVYGVPQIWGYLTTDNMATVEAASYFNLGPNVVIGGNSTWFVGDQIYCVCSDGNITLQIATVGTNALSVTTTMPTADISAGSITTAMLGANIVTAAKIANGTITTTQIGASAGITGAQIAATTIAAGNIANNTITSTQLALNTIQYATVTGITPTTLFSVGTQLVAAPGAGLVILPIAFNFNYIFATAQYTSGGAITVQYGSSPHAGQNCSASLAAATFNGYTVNQVFDLATAVTGASSASINAPLFLTCGTGNFATGAGTITAYVSYIVVAAS